MTLIFIYFPTARGIEAALTPHLRSEYGVNTIVRKPMTTRTRYSTRISSLLFVCMVATGQLLAQSGPQLPDPGNPSVSREEQIQVGFQAAAEVYKQMPVLPDNSPETQYIRQLGQRLASTIPQEVSWPWEFHAIAQSDINAFALPGGPMFVNVGTVNAANNEAQLAGVMAHEMAHVYMQHSAKQMQKGQTTQALAGILVRSWGLAAVRSDRWRRWVF